MAIVPSLPTRPQLPTGRIRRSDGLPWTRTPPDPRYQRKRLPAEVEPRSKWWRRDLHIAIDEALTAGQLTLHVAALIRALLSFSDDRGKDVWAGQRAIGVAMGGRSDRTVRRLLRKAEAAGWVAVEHRVERIAGGRWRGLPNLSRVTLPDAYRERRAARKAAIVAPKPPPKEQPQSMLPAAVLDSERSQRAAEAAAAPEELTVVEATIADRTLMGKLARLRAGRAAPAP